MHDCQSASLLDMYITTSAKSFSDLYLTMYYCTEQSNSTCHVLLYPYFKHNIRFKSVYCVPNKVADHLQLTLVRKKLRQTSDRVFLRTRVSLSGVAQPRGNNVPLRRLQIDSCCVYVCSRILPALCAHHSLTQYTLPVMVCIWVWHGLVWVLVGYRMVWFGVAWYGSSVALARLTAFSDLTACHVSHIHYYLKPRAAWLPAYLYPRTILNGHVLTTTSVLCGHYTTTHTTLLSLIDISKTGRSILSQYLKRLTLA